MKDKLIKVGITHGDINGISYEVIIKAFLDTRMFEICTPIVYGSPKIASYHRKALNIDNFSFNLIKFTDEANIKRANLINCCDETIKVDIGTSTTMAGEASYLALERAISDLKEGKIDVLVTAPINKHNIQSNKFNFPGHTEYLLSKFKTDEVLMLMVSDKFKVGVVSGHVPLSKVISCITVESILTKLRILNKSLKNDFGVRRPKIAILGINPHAGDNGLLGSEEIDIIIPAIKIAQEESINALGPYAADSFFGINSFMEFDGILAMYHDQGLIPFKALTFEEGVNFTAGLPIVRTSPAHGTAYNIAGKNVASPDSFRKAIYLACDIYHNRVNQKEISKNPLKRYDISD